MPTMRSLLPPRTLRVLALAAAAVALPAHARTYDLVIAQAKLAIEPGRKPATQITMNGTVPGPTLRFREGEEATIRVTNRLNEKTSIHWHGLLLPGGQDGAPGFNAFRAIAPGETFTYKFRLRQNGTYWYHSHSATQEQAGQYAAFIIDPAGPDPIASDREHVVVLSELTREDPERIIRNLKGDAGYYNFAKRTTPEFFRDAAKFGLGKTLADRAAWGRMRMDPTDIADVGDYTLLVNGKPTAAKPWLELKAGERTRLRFVNGSAMSFMDVRIPDLPMTVVMADGRRVEPVTVDEFRIGVAETYDVIVEPKEDRAYPLWVETLDRKASVLASLAPREGMAVAQPAHRPRQVLLMSEMGHAMGDMAMGGTTPAGGDANAGHVMTAAANGAPVAASGAMAGMDVGGQAMPGMDHAAMGRAAPDAMTAELNRAAGRQPQAMQGMDMGGMAMGGPAPGSSAATATDPSCPPEHAAMGHCTPKAAALAVQPAGDPSCPPEHAAMGHCTPKTTAPAPTSTPAAADPSCPPEHAAMGHCMPKPPASPAAGPRVGTGVALGARAEGGTSFPKVDYGFGGDAMAGMDHSAMGHGGMGGMGGMAMPALAREGDTDGSGRVFGWATGAPYGARVLSVRDLRAAEPQRDTRAPTREIVIKVSGNMERYIWTLNGAKFGEAPPIRVKFGERVRITFVNETMMAHPMHLHGMFFQVENGQPMGRLPDKNVIAVAPGKTQSILLTANEAGEWPLHCHLLYHMESGMMQKLVVATVDNPDGTPAAPAAHAGHGM